MSIAMKDYTYTGNVQIRSIIDDGEQWFYLGDVLRGAGLCYMTSVYIRYYGGDYFRKLNSHYLAPWLITLEGVIDMGKRSTKPESRKFAEWLRATIEDAEPLVGEVIVESPKQNIVPIKREMPHEDRERELLRLLLEYGYTEMAIDILQKKVSA